MSVSEHETPTEPCSDCGGSRWRVTGDEEGPGTARRCTTCEPGPAARRIACFRRAGVPLLYQQVFTPPDPPPVVAKGGKRWDEWSGDPPLLFLWGETGSGKSMLAAEILWRLASPSGSARWCRAGEIPSLAYSRNELDQARLSEFRDERVLVLDELGRAHQGGAWEAVSELVAVRHEWLRPTIVTSNLALDAILDQSPATGPLVDRLASGLVMHLTGESRRA